MRPLFVEGEASALDFGEDFGALGLPLVLASRRLDIVHPFFERGEAAGADYVDVDICGSDH